MATKSEILNPKLETNSKFETGKTKIPFKHFGFSSFVSDFDIRISDLSQFKKIVSLLSVFAIGIATCCFAQTISSDDRQELIRQHQRLAQIYQEHGLIEDAQRELAASRELDPGSVAPAPAATEQSAAVALPAVAAKEPTNVIAPGLVKQYLIGSGDVLFIAVWENPDLTQEVIVRPDGKLSFPLLGELTVAGLSFDQLTELLTTRLKEYVRFPSISISLRKAGGDKVYILGEVRRPGIYSLTESKTVLEAVSMAGGITEDGIGRSVIVIKDRFSAPVASRVNIDKALLKGKMDEDIALASQDIVYVPRRFIADLNYFMSKLLNPFSTVRSVSPTGTESW